MTLKVDEPICHCCPELRPAEEGSLACSMCNAELFCLCCAECLTPYHAEATRKVEREGDELMFPCCG
ncbi:hypothetical protein GCM10023146_41530 [Nocardioides caricicola]